MRLFIRIAASKGADPHALDSMAWLLLDRSGELVSQGSGDLNMLERLVDLKSMQDPADSSSHNYADLGCEGNIGGHADKNAQSQTDSQAYGDVDPKGPSACHGAILSRRAYRVKKVVASSGGSSEFLGLA